MEFAFTDLRERLLTELRQASSAKIAVAFFNPEAEILTALRKVPRLRLLVANDFQVNNPDSLEALSEHGHWVRAVSAEAHGGNLHSKVYLVIRKDKSSWAMVGSANLTRPGLTTNQEAAVILDSMNTSDAATLGEVRNWLDGLFGLNYPEIDFDLARAVYETRNRRDFVGSATTAATRFWALKPGYCGEFWQNFLAENVVAIGWGEMGDPSEMTREEAATAYRKVWDTATDGTVNHNVAQIIKFTKTMCEGDLVLICGRYDAVGKDDRDVYIYGLARVQAIDGECYFYDADSDWYRFKRHATILRVMHSLPRSLLARALDVGSIVPTIQELDSSRYARLGTLLQRELGIVLDV